MTITVGDPVSVKSPASGKVIPAVVTSIGLRDNAVIVKPVHDQRRRYVVAFGDLVEGGE